MIPENEVLHLLRDLRRQWTREVRAEWQGRMRALMAERDGLRAELEDKRLQFAAETLRHSEALVTIARMTDALRRCRVHLAHPALDGIWALARLLDTILAECPPPLLVVKVPETPIPPEQVRAIGEQFNALKGKDSFHDVLVLEEQAIQIRAAEALDRLDASLAQDALDDAMSDVDVAAELRAAGADPEQIGREGEALVRELAAKLPADDPRRVLVLGPEQPLPATVLSVQVLDGPSGSVLVPCEERVHLAVENLAMPPAPVTPSPFTGAEPDVLVVEGECKHDRVAPVVSDQTLGIECLDCNTILCVCWMDEHIPESLWNRACPAWPDANPCIENRDDVCALCKKPIPQEAAQAGETGFLGIPVGSTVDVDLDAAARSGAFEAAIDRERPIPAGAVEALVANADHWKFGPVKEMAPEPVVVRDDEVPPEE